MKHLRILSDSLLYQLSSFFLSLVSLLKEIKNEIQHRRQQVYFVISLLLKSKMTVDLAVFLLLLPQNIAPSFGQEIFLRFPVLYSKNALKCFLKLGSHQIFPQYSQTNFSLACHVSLGGIRAIAPQVFSK